MRTLLLLFWVLQIVYCSCPEGFELVRDGECRGYYATVLTESPYNITNTAIPLCKEIQGQPVIIHNEEGWCATPKLNYGDGRTERMWITEMTQEVVDMDEDCWTTSSWYLNPSDNKWYRSSLGNVLPYTIFCTTQLEQPVRPADGCDSFEGDSEDGICYQVGGTAETWHEAQMICKKLGANLASIHNQQENSFLRRLAVSKGAVNGLFLGATVSGKGNNFGWVDGTEWDYENFYPGFPIPGYGDCLAMDTSSSAGEWMNSDCSKKFPVACVREQRVGAPVCSTDKIIEGAIMASPGFPYSASTSCNYILTAEDGKKVELEIILLEANSCCDFLVLYDDFIGGNVIANSTGEMSNVTYTSPTNIMKASWQPNGGVNVRGVAMTFRGV